MGTLAYTTLGSLTSGATENISDVVTALNEAKDSVNNITSAQITDGTITGTDVAGATLTNTNISASAAIAYSKLALTGSVTNADLAGSIADSKLVSPGNPAYKGLLTANSWLVGASQSNGAAPWFLGGQASITAGTPIVSGTSYNGGQALPPIFYLTAAEYAVAGMTTKLNLRATVTQGNVGAGLNLTFGLHPITISGASAGNITLNAGTIVSGSTTTVTSPSANTVVSAASGDFSLPSDGAYALCYSFNGTLNTPGIYTAQLRVRNV